MERAGGRESVTQLSAQWPGGFGEGVLFCCLVKPLAVSACSLRNGLTRAGDSSAPACAVPGMRESQAAPAAPL